MTFLTNTPYTYALVRNEFLFDEQHGHGEYTPCTIFGFRAEPARVPMFQIMLENGAQWARVPIHMLVGKPCEQLGLSNVVWWDSFSRNCAVHQFEFLRNHRVSCLGRDKVLRQGAYQFTIDWCDGGWSEISDQHKNHHIILLDSGQFIAYPNNRLLWIDDSHIKHTVLPKYISPSRSYSVEGRVSDNG